MKRAVFTHLGILLRVRVRIVLQQRLNHSFIFGGDGCVQRRRAIDVATVYIGLAIVKQCNDVVNVAMVDGIHEYVGADVLDSRLHNGNESKTKILINNKFI